MTAITAYLSPNGRNRTEAAGPATRLMAATAEGMVTLERADADAPWEVTGRSLTDRHLGQLVFEAGSGKLFAGAHNNGGLWVSDDGEGADWRALTNGLDRPHIYALAARRQGIDVALFLGTSPAGLYRSDDLGENWREITAIFDVPDTDKWTFPPPPHIPHVKDTVFHPSEPKTIFVLIEQGALLKSVDDGATWIELSAYSDPDEIAYRDLHRLLIDPDDHNVFYLASGEGLYRSDDAGESWEQLTRRGDRLGYPDFLYLDPHDKGVLYMGGSYRNPGYWGEVGIAESAVMRSTDRGQSWEALDNGIPQPVVGAFEAMSMHQWPGGMMLLIGTATGQIYASENGGQAWDCIAAAVGPVAKDDHHVFFLPPEKRAAEEARRHAGN